MRSADGMKLLKDKTAILCNWTEHFQALFNTDRVVHDLALLRISQLPVKVKMDKTPTMQELTKAVEQVKGGKAARVDWIPPELLKNGGSVTQQAPQTPCLLLGTKQIARRPPECSLFYPIQK